MHASECVQVSFFERAHCGLKLENLETSCAARAMFSISFQLHLACLARYVSPPKLFTFKSLKEERVRKTTDTVNANGITGEQWSPYSTYLPNHNKTGRLKIIPTIYKNYLPKVRYIQHIWYTTKQKQQRFDFQSEHPSLVTLHTLKR